MANHALFDIETKIDWKLLESIEGCDRDEYVDQKREQAMQDDRPVWIPHSYHIPVVIAVGLIDPVTGALGRLGCMKGDDSEAICREWWDWVGRFQSLQKGTLVGFNSRNFDLPVLELAALRWGIRCPHHFNEKYGNRYRFQDDFHLDVLDYLTGWGAARGLRGGLSLASGLVGMKVKSTAHTNLEDDIPLERLQRWARNDVRRLYAVFHQLQYIRGRVDTYLVVPELEDEE
jgi:hypothetical protein